MPESLLTLLKFVLVAIIWLFFLRVLRATWSEVGSGRAEATPGATPPAAASRPAAPPARRPGRGSGPPTKLRVVEPAASRGVEFAIEDEMTVGQAAGCQIRLDDTYASRLHARIFRQAGEVFIEDLGSKNHTYVTGRGSPAKVQVTAPQVLRTGDRVLIGATVLEAVR